MYSFTFSFLNTQKNLANIDAPGRISSHDPLFVVQSDC